jgi:hypothetical protein
VNTVMNNRLAVRSVSLRQWRVPGKVCACEGGYQEEKTQDSKLNSTLQKRKIATGAILSHVTRTPTSVGLLPNNDAVPHLLSMP